MNPYELSEVIGAIYDCALEPERWPHALERVCDLCELPFAFVLAHDVQRNQPGRVFHHGGRPEWLMQYCGQYSQVNPLFAASWLRPLGEVYTPERLLTDEEWFQSRFYNGFMRSCGIADFIGLMGLRSGARAVWFTAAKVGEASRFSDAEAEPFRLFSPHVCRTIKISHALDLQTLRSESLEAALDALSTGVFLLDGGKKVVHANRLGENQARTGSALRVVQDRLLPTDAGAGLSFARALADPANRETDEISNVHSIAMPAGEGKGLIATVLPVGDGERSNLLSPWSARWAVFVQEPGIVPQIPGEAFAKLYDLTGGELRTILAIAPGLGVSEAADLLGLSEGTVRTHLHRVFEKTGTTRQAELIKLLVSASAPVTPPSTGS
jgi:DNA-binding CsgD family transcriptional regulator